MIIVRTPLRLKELEIINVLKGDMSLVGPRPEMPFIAEGYNEIHRERLKVVPGITGLWQLSGDREKPIHENMKKFARINRMNWGRFWYKSCKSKIEHRTSR